jgi:hypothetical protein
VFRLEMGDTIILGELERYDLGSSDTYFHFSGGLEIRFPKIGDKTLEAMRVLSLEKVRNSTLRVEPNGNLTFTLSDPSVNDLPEPVKGQIKIIYGPNVIQGSLQTFDPGSDTSYFLLRCGLEVLFPRMDELMLRGLTSSGYAGLQNSTIDFNQKKICIRPS